MKKIIKNIIIVILIATLILTYCSNYSKATKVQEIDYTESIENFNNPERGFYDHYPYSFTVSDNKEITSKLSANLIHLRLDIGNFSKAVNGKEDLELSEDMLNKFDEMLKKIKSNGGTAIVRFAYDYFRGTPNLEPSLDMMLRHIEQLCPVFNENADVISYIELGFFGPYGEMHTSKICTYENISKALNVMLDNTVDKIKIGVRRPNHYAKWLGIDIDNINENITEKGTREYRVGVFNDGYLGSGNDLGTFVNREKEITWLEKQSLHTLYGGEVVLNYGEEPINTTEYISKEGFRTHTTYLNSGWNDKVINSWKEEIYNGEDELYKGQSGYLYIANHLGYRFVLRNSELPENVEQESNVDINLDLENVGFGNIVNDKIATIVLENEEKRYEIKTDLQPTIWNSKEITNINYTINLPEDIEVGEWKMYLRVSQYGNLEEDNNYQCIRFANNNTWNEEIGANYIGTINVIEKQSKPSEEETTPPSTNKDEEETTPPSTNQDEEETTPPSTNQDEEETTPPSTNQDEEETTPPSTNQDENETTPPSTNQDEDEVTPPSINSNQNGSIPLNATNKNDNKTNTNVQNNNTTELKNDNSTSNKKLPKTGQNTTTIIISVIPILIGLSIYYFKKLKK